ncbi:MAG: lytic transglycosylase domain-containing protein [Acetobacteraceae bacterium]|nr:lytic transglycosylase domain-containing protein [Acetobacteraceae bacterium]
MTLLSRSTLRLSSRALASVGVLALLQACASQPQLSASGEAHRYRSHARRDYAPPGPVGDPWGPYVHEASGRFDIPEEWIRAVMHQESGGHLYIHGDLVTSGAGAMGLMQVMPDTYDELRSRYPELGDDPFDPHDNIMAGSAYLREMYDIYGSPGFLAAYNAGPGRLDDYLTRNRPLPAETRRYVAAISPNLGFATPHHGSPGALYAMNAIPAAIPAGPRYPDQDTAFVPPPGYVPPNRAMAATYVAPPSYAPPVYAENRPVTAPTPAYAAIPPAPAAPQPVAPAPAPVALAMNTVPPPAPEPPPSPRAEPLTPPLPVARPSYTPPPRPFVQVAELPEETLAETPRQPEPAPEALPEPPRVERPREVLRLPPTRLASREPRESIPLPPALPAHMPFQMAADSQRLATGGHGFHLIAPAMAEPIGLHHGGPATGNWSIQVGAFASSNLAAAATVAAREEAHSDLARAHGSVTQVHQGRATLYRARLQGLSRDGAAQACERLARQRTNCMVVSPDAQS